MSGQNLEIVRGLLDRWRTGDMSLDSFAEDSVWDYTAFPDGRVVHGRDEITRFMRHWIGTWEHYEIHVDKLLDAGEQVVALTRERGRGKGSRAQVELQGAVVFSLDGGKVVHFKGFLDRAEALDAVGLPQ